ncbi:MAG: C45 family peptidase [Muribaculaceae bacterium]|nr:C45 family peptidase [Muribaculaceae bacterium]
MYRAILRIAVATIAITTGSIVAWSCTSAIVSARASADGRPMLWKHRDTGHEKNFIAKVPARDGNLGYVALFNSGDSTLSEAWVGMNESGFAVMNTASYNLAPDTASYKDQEGYVMSLALSRCHNVNDFENLLESLPRPMGVQANFGVIDANGNCAYYETDDYTFRKYDVADTPYGILIRTNFSCSGTCGDGLGRIRYDNARHLIQPYLTNASITPETFTEILSRSFYHSGRDADAMLSDSRYVEDADFIPRRSTSASIVIEGVADGEAPDRTIMWVMMGYPPCSYVIPVTLDHIPEELLPTGTRWESKLSKTIAQQKQKVIVKRAKKYYVDIKAIDAATDSLRNKSREGYAKGRKYRKSTVLK